MISGRRLFRKSDPTKIDALGGAAFVARSRTLAASMPDLILDAQRLASTLIAGVHGRKRSGSGTQFWQFRPYAPGDASSRIDWRRSARGETLFVREMEWENAHTVRIAVDLSYSMRFASPDARMPKRDRAALLALALSAALGRAGERVGIMGGERPRSGAGLVDAMARELVSRDLDKPMNRWYDAAQVRPREDVVIISDFLFDLERRAEIFKKLVARGVRAHLVQVIDPVEETFPYEGRTQFVSIDRNETLMAGRAETWKQEYRDLFAAFSETLRNDARTRGWSHTTSHTDKPASVALLSLHEALARGREG